LEAELGVVLGRVFDEFSEDRFVIVSDQDHFANIGNLSDGLEAVAEDGMTSDFEQGLVYSILSARVDRMGIENWYAPWWQTQCNFKTEGEGHDYHQPWARRETMA